MRTSTYLRTYGHEIGVEDAGSGRRYQHTLFSPRNRRPVGRPGVCFRLKTGRVQGRVDEERHDGRVCVHGEWFGEKICKIVGPGAPDDRKFLALDSVANPVVAHVDAFRSFGLDCPIGDVASALIVDEDSGLALRVTEVGKDRAESGAVLSVHEEGNVFCLSDGGNYAGD